jgi:hypothetical protein
VILGLLHFGARKETEMNKLETTKREHVDRGLVPCAGCSKLITPPNPERLDPKYCSFGCSLRANGEQLEISRAELTIRLGA